MSKLKLLKIKLIILAALSIVAYEYQVNRIPLTIDWVLFIILEILVQELYLITKPDKQNFNQ